MITYAVKVARAVLRGEGESNLPNLPDNFKRGKIPVFEDVEVGRYLWR